MKIKERKIKELVRAEYNPRKLSDKQFGELRDSLNRFGFVDPVLINVNKERENIIIGGHQRTKVWESIGNDTVPCVELDLTIEKEKELNIRLNKSGGEFDFEMLAEHFEQDELIDWGFDKLDFGEELITEEAEEDGFEGPPADQVHTDIVQGDLIEIGEHRLMCGDSTDSDAVAKLMDGNKADMVFTDPPYGMGYKSNGWDSDKTNSIGVKNDEIILGDDNTDVGIDAIRLTSMFIKDDVHLFFWCRWDSFADFARAAAEFSKVKGNIVWDKGDAPGLGDLECSFGGNEMAVHSIVGRRKIKKRINSVWQSNRPKGLSMVHPTQKPIEIIEPAIDNCTDFNDLILDLFLGSGSTMVASHQLKRKCYGMELDPKYCQVIVNRMIALDDSLVIKINGKEYVKD